MSKVSGASELDRKAHALYQFAVNPHAVFHQSEHKCCHCKTPLETYYCEDRLYVVRCRGCMSATLTTANSAVMAAQNVAKGKSVISLMTEEGV